MLRGTECSGIFLKVTLVFVAFTNVQTLQGWTISTFSLTFILLVLSSDFTLRHVHLRLIFFLKICFGILPSSDHLTAENDTKCWQRNRERGMTCNRGPQRTQTGGVAVTWCASYRLLLLQDTSLDWPVFHRFRQLIYFLWQAGLNPADKSGTVVSACKVIKKSKHGSKAHPEETALLFMEVSSLSQCSALFSLNQYQYFI